MEERVSQLERLAELQVGYNENIVALLSRVMEVLEETHQDARMTRRLWGTMTIHSANGNSRNIVQGEAQCSFTDKRGKLEGASPPMTKTACAPLPHSPSSNHSQATRQQSKAGTRNTMRTKWTPEQPNPPAPVIPAHQPSFLRSQDSTRPESTAPTPPKTPPPKMSHCDISPATKVSQMSHFSRI